MLDIYIYMYIYIYIYICYIYAIYINGFWREPLGRTRLGEPEGRTRLGEPMGSDAQSAAFSNGVSTL